MYDSTLPDRRIAVPSAWSRFDLRPKFHGDALFFDAQDLSFYEQDLLEPRFRVWVLIKATNFKLNDGYVKKRLVEEGLRRNVQVRLVAPHRFDLSVSHAGARSIVYYGRRLKVPDCIVTRLGAASDYFGLACLRQLRVLGVPILNGVDGLTISRDKLLTAQVLVEGGIPIPKTLLSMYPFDPKFVAAELGFPLIVKRTMGSRGEAVWKVDNVEELASLTDSLVERDRQQRTADTVQREEAEFALARTQQRQDEDAGKHWISDYDVTDQTQSTVSLAATFDAELIGKLGDAREQSLADSERFLRSPFVFQQFVGATRGRDLRVLVINGKVIGAMMREAAPGGFKANVHQGGSVQNVVIGEGLRDLVLDTARLCNLAIAGVDLMMSEQTYVVCEVNSSPGFEGLEHATGQNIGGIMMEEVIAVCKQSSRTAVAVTEARRVPLQPEHT